MAVVAPPIPARSVAGVWDPVVEIVFKHTGTQNAGAEWVSSSYELPPDEVLEIFRMEIIPPVDADAGVIKKIRYATIMVEGKEYETVRLNSIMAPIEHQSNVGVALDFGVPYLHRPITGRVPASHEATCPKASRGQKVAVKTLADEAISQDYSIVLKAARVRGEDKLREVLGVPGGMVSVEFSLNGERYSKPPLAVTLENFDQLPGGLKQSVPQIFPWFTYARNKVATTRNTWYDFVYDDFAAYPWMDLSWNLYNKEEAYLVDAIGVIPHANSRALRLYIEGRVTNPEFTTRPLPEENFFYPPQYYDVSVNANIKVAGPKRLAKPFLFHGVKGGIQIVDNGTSIPQDGVEVMVWGVKFILK
jgi:hypothetical protein